MISAINNYNPNFIWVKNLLEFQNYITNNNMPDMISFDHDIKPKNYNGQHETGKDVAEWLMNYCKNNNIPIEIILVNATQFEA